MKVGTIIQHKRYPQNGTFKVIENFDEFPKQGITEIIFHPVGEPDKLQAGWARHYEVVESIDDVINQAAKEVQEAVVAVIAFAKARPALIIKPNTPTAESLQPLKDELFWALQRIYHLAGVPNATTEARYACENTVNQICIIG